MPRLILFYTFALLPASFLASCAGLVAPVALKSQPSTGADHRRGSDLDLPRVHVALEQDDEPEEFYIPFPLPAPDTRTTEKPKERDPTKERTKPAAQKSPEPPTALQEVVGPKADDRLLSLWQKELDDAMRQPPDRRKIQFSIPLVQNERVHYFVDYFSGKKKDFFEVALARSGKYIPMMATILRREGLPEDLVYLSLIESGFSVHALSKAKALGPWQFIKETGIRYGLKINHWLDERKDPVKATKAAAAYLKDLHRQFGEWFLAAAAYNAGERKVEKAVQRYQTDDFWRLSQKNYLKSETRNYVPKFIAAATIASAPEKYGFGEIVYERPMEYEEVTIRKPLRLDAAAKLAKTTLQAIRDLNPALLRNITPPNEKEFLLRVPRGSAEEFARAYERLPESAAPKVVTHRVKKGETLLSIAKRYGQRVAELMELNGLRSRRVHIGQHLIVILDSALKIK